LNVNRQYWLYDLLWGINLQNIYGKGKSGTIATLVKGRTIFTTVMVFMLLRHLSWLRFVPAIIKRTTWNGRKK
jgi:hypothetical protein